MTDWSVGRKLDEVIEQNKEIINLMKMQMIVANPNVEFFDLHKQLARAERLADGKRAAERYAEREEWRLIQQAEAEKQKRGSLQKINKDIHSIINYHDSGRAPWDSSYDKNDEN